MKKSLLLLAVAAMSLSANAENFAKGEAFSYDFNPATYEWNLTGADGDDYVQYPVMAFQGQAVFAENLGYTSCWFNGFKPATPAEALENCPAVQYPAEGQYAAVMQTTKWWGFGAFNFALPQVGEPCRVRVVFKVDTEGVENPWYTEGDGKKTFHLRLMDTDDQDAEYPHWDIDNALFWTEPGWRTVDFISELATDNWFMAIMCDAAGLTCSRNVPIYVREISVVPLSKLTGYTAPESGISCEVTENAPEYTQVGGEDGIQSIVSEENGEVEYYNLQGVRVAEPQNGIFVARQGNKATKVRL